MASSCSLSHSFWLRFYLVLVLCVRTNSTYIDPEQGEVNIIKNNGGWFGTVAFGKIIHLMSLNAVFSRLSCTNDSTRSCSEFCECPGSQNSIPMACFQ